MTYVFEILDLEEEYRKIDQENEMIERHRAKPVTKADLYHKMTVKGLPKKPVALGELFGVVMVFVVMFSLTPFL